jgi:tRNA nucleotidyltransferase (CCA-adding enzyme)
MLFRHRLSPCPYLINIGTEQEPVMANIFPESALYMLAQIQQGGHQGFIVGGSVRDMFMGTEPHDIDISSDRTTGDVMSLFGGGNLNRDGEWQRQVIPSGIQFGTVTVRVKRDSDSEWSEYEVTTFRGESGYSDGRHPGAVVFLKSCEADLARRDLTINAIAFDPLSGQIVDPFGGRGDLAKGLIRAVGDPRQRFQEDGLRVVRAIRFASRFCFEIEPETMEAIKEKEAQDKFSCVSQERKRDEFVKIITSAGAVHGIRLLTETGIMDRVVGVVPVSIEQFKALIEREPNCSKEERVAALFSELDSDRLSSIMKGLRFMKSEIEKTARIHRASKKGSQMEGTDTDIRRFVSCFGKDIIEPVINVSEAIGSISNKDSVKDRVRSVLAKNPPLTVKELAVTGRDVAQILGIKPGPRVGEILNKVLDVVIINPELNVQETLENIVRAMD